MPLNRVQLQLGGRRVESVLIRCFTHNNHFPGERDLHLTTYGRILIKRKYISLFRYIVSVGE
jgi:hypothetical protein